MIKEIKEIIEQQEKYKHEKLHELYSIIKEALPSANEKIAWNMPTFYDNGNIIHFYPHKNHIGLYPGSEAIIHFEEQLKNYSTTKGAIQLPYQDEINHQLISNIATYCYESLIAYNEEKKLKKKRVKESNTSIK